MGRKIRAGPLTKGALGAGPYFHPHHQEVHTVAEPGVSSFLAVVFSALLLPALFAGLGSLGGVAATGGDSCPGFGLASRGFRSLPAPAGQTGMERMAWLSVRHESRT
jgi:hypothetical protein